MNYVTYSNVIIVSVTLGALALIFAISLIRAACKQRVKVESVKMPEALKVAEKPLKAIKAQERASNRAELLERINGMKCPLAKLRALDTVLGRFKEETELRDSLEALLSEKQYNEYFHGVLDAPNPNGLNSLEMAFANAKN